MFVDCDVCGIRFWFLKQLFPPFLFSFSLMVENMFLFHIDFKMYLLAKKLCNKCENIFLLCLPVLFVGRFVILIFFLLFV